MSDDDDDIYSDLTCINIVNAVPKVDEEKIKLQNLLEEKEQELNEIRESKNALEKEKKTLEENISSLYKTAVNELKKKDAVIAELTRQKDTILFRREKRHNLNDTKRNLANITQTVCNKQPSIEKDEIVSVSVECKSVSVLSNDQKTSKCETVYSDETTVKHINKEDSSSDNSSVKCDKKYSSSKLDLPLKIEGERNCGSRSQSSERNPEEIYTSYGHRSSRSAYNDLGSRSKNGERSKGERSKDAGREYSSYRGDRKRQRYDTQEDYRERGERYYPRSSVRSPSPKRSRRENSHQRYNDWKHRNSRSNYSRQPPSDSVRVATQVKSKYSKADRERSLSRTPVKKQKSPPILKSSELLGRSGVISKLQLRNSAEKKMEIDDTLSNNNNFPSSKYILDPKDIKVAPAEKNVPCVSKEVERTDKEGIPPPSRKTAKDMSDKNCSKRTKAPRDSSEVQAHKTRNGEHSIITKHQSKSEINSSNDVDSLGNDIKTIPTEKEYISDCNIRPKEVFDKINHEIINPETNLSSNDVNNKIPLKEYTVSGKSKLKNHVAGLSKENSCVSEETGQTPNRSTDISKQNMKQTEILYEQHLSKNIRDHPTKSCVLETEEVTCTNLKGRNSSERVKRLEQKQPPVEHHSRISKDNVTSQASIRVSPLVDKGTDDGKMLSNLPETQSSETCKGNVSKSPITLLTPPHKATAALKVSPSFDDPAVIKDHKFSYTVFNEQCDFHRPNCKKSIRLSGGSCGNKYDLSSKVLRKSDSSLYCHKLDEEKSSGKRGIDRGKLATNIRNPPATENKSFQKPLAQVKLDTMQECPETNTKQAIDTSYFQSESSNEDGHLLSSKAKLDSSFTKTSLSTSKTNNPIKKSFSNVSVNFDFEKGKDSVSVKGLEKNSKENLSIIKETHETVKEGNSRVKSKELKSRISSGENHVDVKKYCVPSSLSLVNREEYDRTPLEKRITDCDMARVVSSEREPERRILDSVCNAVKANLEKADEITKQGLNDPNVSKSYQQIPCKITERQDISDKSANETLKCVSDKIGASQKDVQKPKVPRTIIVSKFRRKNANFQDSPTPVLTPVKSNAKQ